MTFHALGEPSRLRIVELLRTGPLSVGEIADRLGIRQPQASKHLKVLHESGLVSADRVARQRIYHLERESFTAIVDWVESFEQLWEVRLDSLGTYLDTLVDPPADRPGTSAPSGPTDSNQPFHPSEPPREAKA